MSWFSRSFSMKDEEERRRRREDDGDEKEEDDGEAEEEEERDSLNLAEIASATGASVKEDLSNFGRTFTRQLWGVASFLAPPPPEKSSLPAERKEIVTGESSYDQGHVAVVRSSSGAKASETEFRGGNEGISTLQDTELEERDAPVTVSPPHHIASSGEKMPLSQLDKRGLERPKLSGLQSDFAELRGSVATGISRIASVLREVARDDDSGEEEEEQVESLPVVSSRDSPHRPFSSPKGSEQSLNSPRRGFDTFLKPLFGNMLIQERSPSGEDDGTERGVDDSKESPGKGEQKFRELESLPSSLIASGIGGITKFASSLLQIVGDSEYQDQEDDLEDQDLAEAGLTESVVIFARNIAMHPETWLEFPLTEDEADDEFELTNSQKDHVRALAVAAPGLEALKIELCPNYLTEGRFWKIYFVLMHSRLSLNEALILSDQQVVKARESMLQELQRRELQTEELDSHQEDLTDVQERDTIQFTQQDSKQGEANFRIPSLLIVPSAVSDPAGSSSFENVTKTEEVSKVAQPMIGSGEGTNLESEPDKGRSLLLHLEDDTEVDEWPAEEPSTKQPETDPHSHLDTSNLDDEDVSFSDLEEDESSDKAAYTNEAVSCPTSKSPGSVVLDSATAIPSVSKETSSPTSQGDGTPRMSSEKGEFNGWFKVDQDDVASAGSSSP